MTRKVFWGLGGLRALGSEVHHIRLCLGVWGLLAIIGGMLLQCGPRVGWSQCKGLRFGDQG